MAHKVSKDRDKKLARRATCKHKRTKFILYHPTFVVKEINLYCYDCGVSLTVTKLPRLILLDLLVDEVKERKKEK